jgi:expansin
MNRLAPLSRLLCFALFTLSCIGDRAPDSVVIGELSGSGLSATIALSSDWGGGYCANVTVTNTGASATTTWQVVINLNQSTAGAPWSATATTSGSQLTNGPLAWNAALPPGGTTTYGFCATATGTSYHPTLVSVSGGGSGATTGAAGTSGAAGTTGKGGTTGAAGTTGVAGTTGKAGTTGTAGATGKAGTTGTAGTTGVAGTTGKAGTTGTAGTNGAAGTSGGTQCTLPWTANNGSGSFTWYYFGQGSFKDDLGYRTACGYIGQEPSGQDSDTIANIATPGYFAAVPGSGNFSTVDHCGACAQITNGSKSVIVTVVDECPVSSNPVCANNPNGHLDLSRPAFNALGFPTGDPTGTSWKYVPCPVSGGIVVRVKEGNPNQVYIENVVLPIASVTANGSSATHLSYGAWQLSGNATVGETLTLTDVSGRITNVQIASTSFSSNVGTGAQEPLCR